jgi:hypothetical protein
VIAPLASIVVFRARVEVAGFELRTTFGSIEVLEPVVVVEVLKVTVCWTLSALSPAAGDTVDVKVIEVTSVVVADAEVTEGTTPRPKAATATSAMRLKVVFVDICFLSISRSREFPPVGLGNKCLLICHERALFERSGVLVVTVSTLGV